MRFTDKHIIESLTLAIVLAWLFTSGFAQVADVPGQGRDQANPILLPMLHSEVKLFGFCDLDEEWVIQPKFKQRAYFSDGVAVVKTDRGYGVLHPNGEVHSVAKISEAFSFQGQLAAARRGRRWGYINQQGQWHIDPVYSDAMSFANGVAFVKSANPSDRKRPWGIIDSTGAWRCTPRFVEVSPIGFSDGFAVVNAVYATAPEWQIVDTFGQVVSQRSFSKPPGRFDNGLSLVELPDEKPFYVGPDGNRRGPDASKFYSFGRFNEGVAPAAVEGDIRILWGYIDITGEWVIPAEYLDTREWGGDVGPVQIQEAWSAINRTGKIICSAEFAHISTFGHRAVGIAEVRRTSGEMGYLTDTGRFIGDGRSHFGPEPVVTDRHFGLLERALRKELDGSAIEVELLDKDVEYSGPGYQPRLVLSSKRRLEPIKHISLHRSGHEEHYWLIENSSGEWVVFFSAIVKDGVQF